MPRSSILGTLSNAHRDVIAALYESCALTRDELPYTEQFDVLYEQFVNRTGRCLTKHEFWRALSSIGKQTGLARKVR